MKRPTKHSLIGKWRIIEMELWDKDFLDMMEPAYIAFDGKAGGEFAFGCVTGGLHCRKAPDGVEFTWEGNNEMDKASGDGGPNFKRMDRLPEKSASITVTIQPSRLADGEFFSSLLEDFGRGFENDRKISASASPHSRL